MSEPFPRDSVALCVINRIGQPNHDMIAPFLRCVAPLFVGMLPLERAMSMLKLGVVAIEGTKVGAEAFRHSALMYGYTEKLEKWRQQDVRQFLPLAELATVAGVPDVTSIPEKSELRNAHLSRPPRRRCRSERARLSGKVRLEGNLAAPME